MSTSLPTADTQARAALELLREVPWERKEQAMALLTKLLGNIIKEPENAHYRTLNELNQKLSAKLFSVPGCLDFLHAVGFHHSGSNITFKGGDDEDLSSVRQLFSQLEEFVEEEAKLQWRKERDERIAKERVAEEKPSAIKCRARAGLQAEKPSAIKCGGQAEAQLHKGSCSFVSTQITVALQGLSRTFSVTVPIDETVGFLRLRASELGNNYPHQIRLVSASSGSLLRWDHDTLKDVGITDNTVVMLGVGAVDEIEAADKEFRERFGEERKLVDKDTWAFTRELLEAAIQSGLPAEKVKGFKRSLHAGALSPKELRDLIIEEMADVMDEASPLKKVAQKFVGSHARATVTLKQAEKERDYAIQIGKDNAAGLIAMQKVAFTGLEQKHSSFQ